MKKSEPPKGKMALSLYDVNPARLKRTLRTAQILWFAIICIGPCIALAAASIFLFRYGHPIIGIGANISALLWTFVARVPSELIQLEVQVDHAVFIPNKPSITEIAAAERLVQNARAEGYDTADIAKRYAPETPTTPAVNAVGEETTLTDVPTVKSKSSKLLS